MWDEDPRYVEAWWQFLKRAVVFGLVLGTLLGLWTGDFRPVVFLLSCVAYVGAASFIVGLMAWCIFHCVLKSALLIRLLLARLRRR